MPVSVAASAVTPSSREPTLAPLIDTIAEAGRGVVLTMGKGGVVKTTVAAAIAVELARRGLRVRLSTTDPAAHVADAVGTPPPGLTVSGIDPAAETRTYTAEVLSTVGPQLEDKGRALLEEDLRSPCTGEVAVFRAFARAVADGEDGVVILDTAPTGHTILLLDAAESYHREVLRQGSRMPESVRSLLPRLRDPQFMRVLLVTLPEATPVHGARALQNDLARAGIAPFAWVVNQALTVISVRDPLLAARRAAERTYLDEVASIARTVAVVPWVPEPPRGSQALAALAARSERHKSGGRVQRSSRWAHVSIRAPPASTDAGGAAMAQPGTGLTITEAAFRSSRTRAVISTGRFHDITLLPSGLDADLSEWQAGFVDATGRFMDRREAAAAVGHGGRLESHSYFAGDREPTLEAGHAESFRRAA